MAERRPVGFGRREGDGGACRRDAAASRPGRRGSTTRPMARLIPLRDARGHKGTFGKLLVIAGSLDYAGAALLVCRAAGRAGAGLVTLAVPESLQPLFAAKVVEATTMALPEDDVEEVDPGARPREGPRSRARRPGDRPRAAPVARDRGPAAPGADGARGGGRRRPSVLDAEALRTLASADELVDRGHAARAS